ncbi:MAG: DUF6789 family protein [Pseudomonadota bacterium]
MARALLASIFATAAVSVLVYFNARMELLPAFDLFADIGRFNERIGLPNTSQAIWLTHAIIGVIIFGAVFAIIQPILPGRGAVRGLWFGFIAWLVMMVAFMPLAQHEIFALDEGPTAAAMMLGFNLLYGIIFGITYSAFGEAND